MTPQEDDRSHRRLDATGEMAAALSHPKNPVEVTLTLDAVALERITTWSSELWPGIDVTPAGVIECALEVLQTFLRGEI